MEAFVDRRDLKITDLMNKDHEWFKKINGFTTIGTYDMLYKQDINQFHRFPELVRMFENGYHLQYNSAYDTFRAIRVSYSDNFISDKEALQVAYDAFAGCKNFAIVIGSGTDDGGCAFELTGSKKFVDEDFDAYRNRLLFDLRDTLGIDHWGKGKDSEVIPSKYRRGRLELL